MATPAGRSLQSTRAPWRPGPGHQADEAVHEHRPRGARERAGVAGEEHAQALADDPDAEHPDERHRQRGRTVRRKSSPTPMKSWISAKKVFHTAMSGDTKFPMWVMRSPRTKGCPLALARMLVSTKPRPNMKGWNCRAASRIQKRPRTTWSTRWERTASGKRLWGRSAARPPPAPRSRPGAPVAVHALPYATGAPADGQASGPAAQGSSKSWVMQLVGVTASRHGLPVDVVVHVQRRAVEAGVGRDVRLEVGQRARPEQPEDAARGHRASG